MARPADPARHRIEVASRAVAAIAGGYGVAALGSVALALAMPALLGMARSEAVLIGMLLSFPMFAGAVIWVFAARTALRAWTGLAIPALVLGLVILLALRAGPGG